MCIVSFQIGSAHTSLDSNKEEEHWRYFVGGGFGFASLLYTEPLTSFVVESGFSKQYNTFFSGEYSLRASTRSFANKEIFINWTDTLVSWERNNNIIVDIGYTFNVGIDISKEVHLFIGTGIGFFFNIYSRRNYSRDLNGIQIEEGSENTMDFDLYDPFYFGLTMRHNIGIRWRNWQGELLTVQPRLLNLMPSNDGYSLSGLTVKYFIE